MVDPVKVLEVFGIIGILCLIFNLLDLKFGYMKKHIKGGKN